LQITFELALTEITGKCDDCSSAVNNSIHKQILKSLCRVQGNISYINYANLSPGLNLLKLLLDPSLRIGFKHHETLLSYPWKERYLGIEIYCIKKAALVQERLSYLVL